ncbi:MAG: glycosyltransferase family 39 protein [Chloroflexota bacterium]
MSFLADPRNRHRIELAVLLGLLVLAALLRLPGLPTRGAWDSDQGHDMFVLRALVVDGTVPLVGPPASIGTFHHGAAYYYLLSPAAFLSGADPLAITFEIALFGIGTVAAAWWLARLVGGPAAAAIAGLLVAVSPSAIGESIYIWNPNVIPLLAAVAFAGTVLGCRSGHARWWLLAGLATMLTMQAHLLGIVIVVPIAWAWLSTLRRTLRLGDRARGVILGGLGGLAIIAAGYLPLLVEELGSGFTEVRAVLAYLAGSGASGGLLARLPVVLIRALSWPFAGLVTDRPMISLAVTGLVGVLLVVAVWGRRSGGAGEGRAAVDLPSARWLGGAVVWSIAVLAVAAPTLSTVTPGLPNDHYHAFLDPLVTVLTGVGLARIAGGLGTRGAAAVGGPGRPSRVPPAAAGVALAFLLLAEVLAWPPVVTPDGGWPGADAAAAAVRSATGGAPIALAGVPPFKPTDALGFPLTRRGVSIVDPATGPAFEVVICDPLFDAVVGAPCGGPAEDAWLAARGRPLRLVVQFSAGSRRWISIYAAAGSS